MLSLSCQSAGRSATLVEAEIPVGWTAMIFCADIHDTQLMNFNDFGDLAPPLGITMKFATHIHVPLRMKWTKFGVQIPT